MREQEREGKHRLRERFDKQAAELRQESASRDEWRGRAEDFAADCEALQAHMQSLTGDALTELRASRVKLHDSIASLVDRSTFVPKEAPRPRSGQRRSLPAHLGRPSSGGARSARSCSLAPGASPGGGAGAANGGALDVGAPAASLAPGSMSQAALG